MQLHSADASGANFEINRKIDKIRIEVEQLKGANK